MNEEALQTAGEMKNLQLAALIQIESLLRLGNIKQATAAFEASEASGSRDWHQEVSRLFFEGQRFEESQRILEKALAKFVQDEGEGEGEDLALNLILVAAKTTDCARILTQFLGKCTVSEDHDPFYVSS